MAAIDSFLTELPVGIDTHIGERGVKLSGGQKQRVAIARALYHDPDILIFDEATSYIDSSTELAIQQALEKLMQDRTALVVAHRLSTVRNADRIIVLNRGRIIETGNHTELMHRKGFYFRLHQLQNGNQMPSWDL